MTPVATIILIGCLCCVLFLSKRIAALALIAGTLYLAQSQSIAIAGFLLYPTRLLGIAAILRVIAKHEFSLFRINKVDSALLLLYGFTTVVLLLRPEESIPLRIAKATDVIFCYFSFRAFLRTLDDVRWLLFATLFLLIPYSLLLGIEYFAKSRPFAIFGASEPVWLREGRPRCFGTFRHPSLLGSVGATMLPLYLGFCWDSARQKQAVLGVSICTAIVIFSNSGGPLSAAAMAIIGWCFWPFRHKMRLVRRSLVVFIALMALVMNAPVWYLLAKLSAVTGGTGWHRSYLIDVSIRNLDKWWFAGLPISETQGWFPYNLSSTGGADITNQFISFGLNGGLIGLAIFILLISRAFSLTGSALRITADNHNKPNERLIWSAGVMVAVHVANWLGITYWDQFYVIFLAQLTIVVTASLQIINQPELNKINDPEEHLAGPILPTQA